VIAEASFTQIDAVDVATLDGRDERSVQHLHRLVRDLVGFRFDRLDALGLIFDVTQIRQQRLKHLGPSTVSAACFENRSKNSVFLGRTPPSMRASAGASNTRL
jgi:hypothetical protein